MSPLYGHLFTMMQRCGDQNRTRGEKNVVLPLIRAGPGTRASKVTDPMSAAGECSSAGQGTGSTWPPHSARQGSVSAAEYCRARAPWPATLASSVHCPAPSHQPSAPHTGFLGKSASNEQIVQHRYTRGLVLVALWRYKTPTKLS